MSKIDEAFEHAKRLGFNQQDGDPEYPVGDQGEDRWAGELGDLLSVFETDSRRLDESKGQPDPSDILAKRDKENLESELANQCAHYSAHIARFGWVKGQPRQRGAKDAG